MKDNIIIIEKHKSSSGLICVGGLNKNKKWLDDGKNLQRNFSQGERIYSVYGKSPCLSAHSGGSAGPGNALITQNINKGYRKLTPIECERLQTIPDNYTEGISNSQRHKAIGNCWTIDVISHILKNIDMNIEDVLSCFDGISCGQLALERAGIKINNYYASEIDKYAIQITMKNYTNTKQVGDITKISYTSINGSPVGLWDGSVLRPCNINLLIGGSPCQGFSFAGKQLNFDDPRSKLFFEYVRLLKEIRVYNPDVLFLLENVKMKKEYQDVISEALGVQPIEINSALVSAQNRKRLYWTNIKGVVQPEDKGILLKDIIIQD